MTTWKDGGDCGRVCRGIINEEGSQDICRVWVRREVFSSDRGFYKWNTEPWSEGEANFRLVLQAPQMLAALEAIRDQAECYLQPLRAVGVSRARWEAVRDRAVAAIAAAKGEDNGKAELA